MKSKTFDFKYLLGLVALGAFVPTAVWGVGVVTEGFRVTSAGQDVDAHGTCKALITTDGKDRFVPTQSSAGWTAFLNNTPSGVTVADCVGAVVCGDSWTLRSQSADSTWTSVTYGNGTFVAVASNPNPSKVMTSTNGVNWTTRTQGADAQWQSVTYGGGQFVAVGGNGTDDGIMTSPDGITWTGRSQPVSANLGSVAYGNGIYVAFSNTSNYHTSSDGINWTNRTNSGLSYTRDVSFNDGRFVTIGRKPGNIWAIAHSTDGVNWTTADIPVSSNAWGWASATYNNGVYVIAGSNEVAANRISHSTDNGATWTGYGQTAFKSWEQVRYLNGRFIAVSDGFGTNIAVSDDGTAWDLYSASTASDWNDVTYGNGKYIAVGINGTSRVMTSDCP